MAEYSVKELARTFGCTKQAIFNEMDNMSKLGYARKEDGQYFINEAGFNYLMDKKSRNGKTIKADTEPKEKNEKEFSSQVEALLHQQICSLQNQLEEMRKEKEYFKTLAENKDKQIISLQADLKEVSIKAMALYLPKAEEEKEHTQEAKNQEEHPQKKGFFSLFGNK